MKSKRSSLKIAAVVVVMLAFAGCKVVAQKQEIPTTLKWSERMALSVMKQHPQAYQIDGKTVLRLY
jgi:unsaturated rhamnogalacturonyl hydrolase